MKTSPDDDSCCDFGCAVERRDFIKLATLGVAAALSPGLTALAGPFKASDFDNLVPADKKLNAEWVKSLFARGERTVYRGGELERIGGGQTVLAKRENTWRIIAAR